MPTRQSRVKTRATRKNSRPITRTRVSNKKKKSTRAGNSAKRTQRVSVGTYVLLVVGLVLLLGGSMLSKQLNQLPVSDSPTFTAQANPTNPAFVPEQISIGNIIDAPVIAGNYVDGNWTDSKTAAVYYEGSATPLSGGNTIIYAHNTRNLFGKLKQVKAGDVIAVYLANDQIRQYTVQTVSVLPPTDTSPLNPTNTEQLTLYTCDGTLDSQRLVVVAVPVSTSEELP